MDDVSDFNKNYLNKLDTYFKENKQVFLIDDFNINLLNYKDHQSTNKRVDSLASSSSKPYILQPTRITSHSKTLTNDIFSNIIFLEVISDNVTATISNHLPQFSFSLMYIQTHHPKKQIFIKNICRKLLNSVLNYFDKDWLDVIQLD